MDNKLYLQTIVALFTFQLQTVEGQTSEKLTLRITDEENRRCRYCLRVSK